MKKGRGDPFPSGYSGRSTVWHGKSRGSRESPSSVTADFVLIASILTALLHTELLFSDLARIPERCFGDHPENSMTFTGGLRFSSADDLHCEQLQNGLDSPPSSTFIKFEFKVKEMVLPFFEKKKKPWNHSHVFVLTCIKMSKITKRELQSWGSLAARSNVSPLGTANAFSFLIISFLQTPSLLSVSMAVSISLMCPQLSWNSYIRKWKYDLGILSLKLQFKTHSFSFSLLSQEHDNVTNERGQALRTHSKYSKMSDQPEHLACKPLPLTRLCSFSMLPVCKL